MSTTSLLCVSAILAEQAIVQRTLGAHSEALDASARLRACEAEIARRQAELRDEVEDLRRRNQEGA